MPVLLTTIPLIAAIWLPRRTSRAGRYRIIGTTYALMAFFTIVTID